MRLFVFEKDGGRALGIRDGEELIDVAAAGVDAPTDISEVLQAGPELLDRLRALPSRALNSARLSCAGLKHKPLALRFPKAICLGLNYLDHAAEAGFSKPEYPTIFHWAPQSSCMPCMLQGWIAWSVPGFGAACCISGRERSGNCVNDNGWHARPSSQIENCLQLRRRLCLDAASSDVWLASSRLRRTNCALAARTGSKRFLRHARLRQIDACPLD
jgi:hypothetical protein